MITLAAQPAFQDIADATWATDQPLYASKLIQLARNAKFGMVRRETFIGLFPNGQTVAAPVSPIDGYQYSYAEISFWWSRQDSRPAGGGRPTAPGTIQQWVDSVSAAGVVSTSTQYYVDGGQATATADGRLMVAALCQRNSTLHLGAVPAWVDVDDSKFGGGSAALASALLQLNKNVRFAAVRKEFFVAQYTNGQTVPLPTSSVDGYTYARGELLYLPSLTSTLSGGGTRSGGGTIRQFGCSVAPTTGVVATFVNYYINEGAYTPTTDGKALVLTVGVRNR